MEIQKKDNDQLAGKPETRPAGWECVHGVIGGAHEGHCEACIQEIADDHYADTNSGARVDGRGDIPDPALLPGEKKNEVARALSSLREKWIGVEIAGSTDCGIDASGRHPRPISKIYYEREFEQFVAFAGEHHRANSPEALARRLGELRGRLG